MQPLQPLHKISHGKPADFTGGICLKSVGLELAIIIGLVIDEWLQYQCFSNGTGNKAKWACVSILDTDPRECWLLSIVVLLSSWTRSLWALSHPWRCLWSNKICAILFRLCPCSFLPVPISCSCPVFHSLLFQLPPIAWLPNMQYTIFIQPLNSKTTSINRHYKMNPLFLCYMNY